MHEPRFLSVEDVLLIHRDGIAEHGGSDGVRDTGLLESAVLAPQNVWQYENGDIAALASGVPLCANTNHAFVDGNKRVALRAADVFLYLNGVELTLSSKEAYALTIDASTGRMSREEIAEVIRANVRPL